MTDNSDTSDFESPRPWSQRLRSLRNDQPLAVPRPLRTFPQRGSARREHKESERLRFIETSESTLKASTSRADTSRIEDAETENFLASNEEFLAEAEQMCVYLETTRGSATAHVATLVHPASDSSSDQAEEEQAHSVLTQHAPATKPLPIAVLLQRAQAIKSRASTRKRSPLIPLEMPPTKVARTAVVTSPMRSHVEPRSIASDVRPDIEENDAPQIGDSEPEHVDQSESPSSPSGSEVCEAQDVQSPISGISAVRKGKPGRRPKKKAAAEPATADLPIFVRDATNQSWVLIEELTGTVTTAIENQHLVLKNSPRYQTMRKNSDKEINGEGNTCRPACMECNITSRNRWHCNTDNQSFEVCDKCLDTAEQPCGRLIDHPFDDGEYAIGYVPLPVLFRAGVAWTELAFWIRPYDASYTKRFKRTPGGMSTKAKDKATPPKTPARTRRGAREAEAAGGSSLG